MIPEAAERCFLEPILIHTARMLAAQGEFDLPEEWHIANIKVATMPNVFNPEESLSRITGIVTPGPRPPSPVV